MTIASTNPASGLVPLGDRMSTAHVTPLADHLRETLRVLAGLDEHLDEVAEWGAELIECFLRGGRLLVVGNGGSWAHASHLVAELVGRYRTERGAWDALVLGADSSVSTALVNDYDPALVFARQVQAHGRAGDVLLAISTSGGSANVLAAADTARARGITVWALTGAAPNPLVAAADRSLAVACRCTSHVQEAHQALVHLLCEAFDRRLAAQTPQPSTTS